MTPGDFLLRALRVGFPTAVQIAVGPRAGEGDLLREKYILRM